MPTALITGASRGLGAALAEALAPSHEIIAVARTSGALESLDDRVRAAGGSAVLAPMDITTDPAMQQLCRSIHDRWGGLDLWVHSAIHATPLASAPDISEKDMTRALDVNVAATSRLIRYLTPLLGTAGRAVFFDDPRSGALWGSYGSTKAAQMALVRSWQEETRRTGPQVMVLQPPEMPTGTRARFYPGQSPENLTHPAKVAGQFLPQILGSA